MFARKVAARLKPNSLGEFTNLMEREVLPWLQKQRGFLDLITLAVPDGTEVAAISFWDQEGNAQVFDSGGYPVALTILNQLLDGIPYVKTFDVVSSTFQRVGLVPLPGAGSVVQEADSAKRINRSSEMSAGRVLDRCPPVLQRDDAAPMGAGTDPECNRQFMTVASEHRQQN